MNLIQISQEKCIGCNSCVRACPVYGANKAETIDGKLVVHIDNSKCFQ